MALAEIYRPRLGLLTDLYQVAMAYGYWRENRHRWQSVFYWTLRRMPFGGAFAIACGQQTIAELIERYSFEENDLDYLSTLEGNDGKPLFARAFLDELSALDLDRHELSLDAAPEGSLLFSREPGLRIQGPLWLCQLLETPVLNQLNFQTLIATKAARVCHLAASGQPVIEFGLRRSHGIDGGVTAARAAYVGGCAGTSNLLAGQLYGIPVMGTHAHSWVLSFQDELESFRSFAASQPNNCVLLVDTFDTERGVEHAIRVGHEMSAKGEKLAGIRLDSGDLAVLSKRARQALDQAGLPEVAIVASNDLDEQRIEQLRKEGARIDIWGVGTRLSTGYPDASVSGVYKLSALRPDASQPWRPVMKLSEERAKRTDPGRLTVRRYRGASGELIGDAIYELDLGAPRSEGASRRLFEVSTGDEMELDGVASEEDLLQPLVREGRSVEPETLERARERVTTEIASLPAGARDLENAVPLPVGLEPSLHRLESELVRRNSETT